MNVEKNQPRDVRPQAGQHRAQQAVGPTRRSAAEKQAIGVAILAPREHVLQRVPPVSGLEFDECRLAAAPGRLVPVQWAERGMQGVVLAILGMAGSMIENVAIDVDVVLVDTPIPGESVRVEPVDQHDRHVVREPRRRQASNAIRLNSRPGASLDAVGATDDQQHATCGMRSDPHDVGVQRMFVNRRAGMLVRVDGCLRMSNRALEPLTRFAVGRGEKVLRRWIHGGRSAGDETNVEPQRRE